MAKKGDFEIRGVLSLDDADLDKEHKVQLKVDAKSAFSTILNINQRLDLLEKTPRSIKLELNAKEVTEKLDKIDGYLKQLRADTKRGNVIKITADTASIRGSIAMLENIYNTYGVDSFIARCASVIVSASETVFYIATMYFSTTKVKKLRYAIPVALLSTYAGVLISCLMCRLL